MKAGMRFFSIILVFLIFIFMPAAVAYAENGIIVTIHGQHVEFEGQQPVIVDDRTLVPVRGVFEHLGFEVDWQPDEQLVMLESPNYTIYIKIGNDIFFTNGVEYTLDTPAKIINGRTMVPIRLILESVGLYVGWSADLQTVLIGDPPRDWRFWQAVIESTQSAAALPNYRLTESMRRSWIDEFRLLGGANVFELEVIRLINLERAAYELPELLICEIHMIVSRFHAQTLADLGFIAGANTSMHDYGPYGGSSELARTFYLFATRRNGHMGSQSPEELVNYWMSSSPHRAGILASDNVSIGVGAALGGADDVFYYMTLSANAPVESH